MRKVIAMSTYENKREILINSPMMNLKLLEKQEQVKPIISRQKEIIKIRAKINEMETKTIQRVHERKSL
jgi:hypothetical protein